MLEMMYSHDSLEDQMFHKNCRFIIITDEAAQAVGFASFGPKASSNTEVYRLHKIYLLPEVKGKGYGKAMMQHVENTAHAEGAHFLELNVNRKNPSVDFYKTAGYTILKDDVADIGNGFVMDDHIMVKKLV